MKRLFLVPEDAYMALSASKSSQKNPYSQQMEEKSQKMAQVLHDSQLVDDEKMSSYGHQFKRMKMFKNALAENPSETVAVPTFPATIPLNSEENIVSERSALVENSQMLAANSRALTAAVKAPSPKKARQLRTAQQSTELERQVARITQTFLQNRTRLPLNAQGLVLDSSGEIIQNSHIARIIKRKLENVMGGRKPNGFDQFEHALAQQPDLQTLFTSSSTTQQGSGIEAVPTGTHLFVPTKWKKL